MELNTPYSALYIGKPNITSREEPHIIYIEENRPYGIKIIIDNEQEMPLASMNSIERYWKIYES